MHICVYIYDMYIHAHVHHTRMHIAKEAIMCVSMMVREFPAVVCQPAYANSLTCHCGFETPQLCCSEKQVYSSIFNHTLH